MSQNLKSLLFIAFSVLVASGCSNGKIQSSNQAQGKTLALTTTNGNGEYYGGKLTTIYTRTIANLACPLTGNKLAEIVISNGALSGTFISPADCSSQSRALSSAEIEMSDYQRSVIGLAEGMYSLTMQDGVVLESASTNEVFCRELGSTSRTGFDVIVNQRDSFHDVLVTTAQVGADGIITRTEEPPFTTGRRLVDDLDRVRYEGSGFKLEIRTQSFNSVLGTMDGEFRYRRNGFDSDRILKCRLGGALDIMNPERPY